MTPTLPDSGSRQTFKTGAVRDTAEGKPMMGLISPLAMRRLAAHLTAGAAKYEARNWEKGIPISRCMDSLLRHLTSYQIGESGEDHLAAAQTNLMFMVHIEEAVKRGILPHELLDLPKYTHKTWEEIAKEYNEND